MGDAADDLDMQMARASADHEAWEQEEQERSEKYGPILNAMTPAQKAAVQWWARAMAESMVEQFEADPDDWDFDDTWDLVLSESE